MPVLVGPGDRIVLPSGRTSSLARPSVPWSQYGGGSTTLLDGTSVSYREVAVRQPWVSIAVNGIARQISRLPLKVYRRNNTGGRDRDRDSQWGKVLSRPGPRRSPSNLKYSIAVGLLVDGNHVEEYHVSGGNPGLRALEWRWLTPWVVDSEVVAWEYKPPQGETRIIDVGDVIHYRWETEGALGVSPLKSLGVTLRSEAAAQQFGESNMKNGARMGMAIMFDPAVKKLDQGAREALREEIEGRYSGPENAGRPLILGGGITDVKDIGAQTATEAALIDQRKLNREEVLGVYNWPPPIAGDLEHGTFSNVAELAKIVFKIVLPPWTGLIEEETTIQAIDPAGTGDHYSEFDFNGVLQGDPTQRMQAYGMGINSGVMTLNDARDAENLPRYEEELADEPMLLGNNIKPLAQVVAEAAAIPGTPADSSEDQE